MITEPVSDRKEQQFSVPRSARIARQGPRFSRRQFSAQAFHDQSVDLLKGLLRDSDVFLALRIDDGLREHGNVGFPCRHYPPRNIARLHESLECAVIKRSHALHVPPSLSLILAPGFVGISGLR